MANRSGWTGDQIVAAIQAWAERTGEPPTVREWRAEPTFPNTALVVRVFGSWSEAIEAAGFTPRRQGNSPGGDSRERCA